MRILRAGLVAAAVACASRVDAQDVAKRVTSADGVVNVIYPSRPTACGDGRNFIQNVLGDRRSFSMDYGSGNVRTAPCTHGPARVTATVVGGEVTRLRVYVGPVPPAPSDVRTINASATEAVEWLTGLAVRAPTRVASDAVLPLIVADAPDPWPLLLRIARDDNRPRDVRRSTLTWLSSAVSDHLGLSDADSHASDDDEVRDQAVFALSQRPKSESVPELIDLARTAKHPAARRAAIFWLGQSGDMRAADVYAELLGIR